MDWFPLLTDHTLRTVALGSALLGASSGLVSVYAVLRRQSLLGDAVSHAALPGVVLAFALTGSKESVTLLVGALAAGWLGAALVLAITRTTRIALDSALGLILSVFFGAGLVLLTFVQRRPDASQAGLDRFLFGQAASLLQQDVVLLAGGASLVALVTLALWKELALRTFDPDYAAVLGLPVRLLDLVISALVVLAIVLGLQAVGVVLMSALVVAPAAAARQWTERLGVMAFLSTLFGAVAGVSGALLSSLVPRLPTGPTIVLVSTARPRVDCARGEFAPRRPGARLAVALVASPPCVEDAVRTGPADAARAPG